MNTENYEIVFRGDIAIGQSLVEVKAALGRLFKLAPAQVDKLFSGRAVVLKKNLSQQQAEQYRLAFAKAGALVTVAAAGESKGRPPRASKAASAAADGAANTPAGRPDEGFTLAPVGSLLGAGAAAVPAPPVPAVDHISLRPSGGNLLDSSEQAPAVTAPISAGNWGLAEVGALLECLDEGGLPLPIPDADWDIAEVGVDLAPSQAAVAPRVTAPALDVAPAGADLADPITDVPLAQPSTEHIQLLDH